MIYDIVLFGCAAVLGHHMAGSYPWDTQQAFAGLIIVVPLAVLFLGMTWIDAIAGCGGLGVGFGVARRNTP